LSEVMIYHSFRAAMFRCRRAVFSGEMSEDEAGRTYDQMHEGLNKQHDPEMVREAYERFEADLKLMDRLEWFHRLGWPGIAIAFTITCFTKQETLDRVEQIWQGLVALDEELLNGAQPGDANA